MYINKDDSGNTVSGYARKQREDQEYVKGGGITPNKKAYSRAAQNLLDSQARGMGYDTIFTAISYEGDIVEKFNAEAVALKSWRSKVWVRANSILEEFEAGSIERPTLEEFVAMLPVYEA